MKIAAKIALLWVILVYGHIGIASTVHSRGYELAILGNLPHRSLGCLWTSHLLLPFRQDYAEDYMTQYVYLVREGYLMEGSKKPVMLNYAGKLTVQFPDSIRLFNCYRDLRSLEKKK